MSFEPGDNADRGARWSRTEVLDLLCTLNLNILTIRSEKANPSDADMEVVIKTAGLLLCSKMHHSSNPKRIQTKLASLWKNCGDVSGTNKPYALYQEGAYTRTLPGLEDSRLGFPGMLNEIAEVLNTHQSLRILEANNATQGQRRSERSGPHNDNLQPIVCRCGFSHDIPSIQCLKCHEWQHTICYYSTTVKDDLPKNHVCDDCDTSLAPSDQIALDPGKIETLFASAQNLGLSNAVDAGSPHRTRLAEYVEANGLSRASDMLEDDKVFWGPTNPEVRTIMMRILSRVEDIVYFLFKAGISRRKLLNQLKENRVEQSSLSSLLVFRHGGQFREQMRRYLAKPIQPSADIAQMLVGMVSSLLVETVFYEQTTPSFTDSLYQSICQTLVDTNNVQALRRLHRNNMLKMLEHTDCADSSLSLHAQSRAAFAQISLESILTRPNREPLTKPSAVNLAPRTWEVFFEEAVSMLMRLRIQLMLSERFYEFSTVPVGMKTASKEMFDRSGDFINDGKVVQVCMMPAIIEYIPESGGQDLQTLLSNPRKVFIGSCAKSSARRMLVSPAIVATL